MSKIDLNIFRHRVQIYKGFKRKNNHSPNKIFDSFPKSTSQTSRSLNLLGSDLQINLRSPKNKIKDIYIRSSFGTPRSPISKNKTESLLSSYHKKGLFRSPNSISNTNTNKITQRSQNYISKISYSKETKNTNGESSDPTFKNYRLEPKVLSPSPRRSTRNKVSTSEFRKQKSKRTHLVNTAFDNYMDKDECISNLNVRYLFNNIVNLTLLDKNQGAQLRQYLKDK